MYTTVVPRPRGHRPRHSTLNQWDLIVPLLPAGTMPAPDTDPVEMPDDPEADARVSSRLEAWGVPPGAELIVMHVGAGNEFRRWPEAAFAEAVAALSSAVPNRRIILITGAAQAAHAQSVRRLAIDRGARRDAVTVACDLDLAEVRSLAGRASLFVGGDSGPAHVASTTSVPMVVIFGPTTDAVWGPWRNPSLPTEIVDAGPLPCRPCDQRRCDPGDFRCLRSIGAGKVVTAAGRALARRSTMVN